MPKIRFRVLCRKCKKFFLPEKTKMSSLGYCKECGFFPGKCRFMMQSGYSCSNDAEFSGYCVQHFLKVPIKKLTGQVKKK